MLGICQEPFISIFAFFELIVIFMMIWTGKDFVKENDQLKTEIMDLKKRLGRD